MYFCISMNVTQYIANKVLALPNGFIFSYSDVIDRPEDKEAAIKALNRMVNAGKLVKSSKGKFYRAEETVFGSLQPDQSQIVKDLLESNGKITGYLTGYSIYNKLGLTTQVSNTIQIGKNEIRYPFKRDRYTIAFIKQKNEITKDNIPLLQILDSIRYVKKIPDTPLRYILERLTVLIGSLSSESINQIIILLGKYPPSTRALTGALLEKTGMTQSAQTVRMTLNPVTVYKMPGIAKYIENAKNWNIL